MALFACNFNPSNLTTAREFFESPEKRLSSPREAVILLFSFPRNHIPTCAMIS